MLENALKAVKSKINENIEKINSSSIESIVSSLPDISSMPDAKMIKSKIPNTETIKTGMANTISRMPNWTQDIIKNRAVSIPEESISNQVQNQFKDNSDIAIQDVRTSTKGINITASNNAMFSVKTNFDIKIIEVDPRAQTIIFQLDNIQLENNNSSWVMNLVSSIVLALTEGFVRETIKDKIGDFSSEEITITRHNNTMICDLSKLKLLQTARHIKIPVINRNVFDIIKVSEVIHNEDNVVFKFDVNYIGLLL